ncbi:MAG TPA: Uma2 family endonuclease [Gemmataceae bacterium]|nr:Uma2 family endonuclease [Gemmataceae bacterium]
MATVSEALGPAETLADLVEQLGSIPLDRIRLKPAPGTATEDDVIASLEAPRKQLCELVDGVLVEKPVGTKEGLLGGVIVQYLWNFVAPRDLGVVIPGDGPLRLWLGLVRIPDASFVSWDRLPGGELPDDPIAGIVPDLAVEVLSPKNTKKEIERKLREYFQAGVRLVWIVDPKTQTAQAYTAPTKFRKIGKYQALTGGAVLPGFTLPLKDLFARLRRRKHKSR